MSSLAFLNARERAANLLLVGDQPSTAWALTRPATNRTEQQQ